MIIARRSWKPKVGKGKGSQVILPAFADLKNNRADPAVVRRRSGFDLPPATCAPPRFAQGIALDRILGNRSKSKGSSPEPIES
jgi:hypothetical protein